jgi:hypothetical protein
MLAPLQQQQPQPLMFIASWICRVPITTAHVYASPTPCDSGMENTISFGDFPCMWSIVTNHLGYGF